MGQKKGVSVRMPQSCKNCKQGLNLLKNVLICLVWTTCKVSKKKTELANKRDFELGAQI